MKSNKPVKASGEKSKSNPKLMVLLAIVLIGAGAYYYLTEINPSLLGGDETTIVTANPAARKKRAGEAPVEGETAKSNGKIKFLMREIKGRDVDLEVKRVGLTAFFATRGSNVEIEFMPTEGPYVVKPGFKWDMLFDSVFIAMRLVAEGEDIEPVLYNKICTSDTHMITPLASTLSLETIKDAKKIVLFNASEITAAQLAMAESLGVDPSVLYVSDQREKLVEAIKSNQVDAVIEVTISRDENKYGTFSGRRWSEVFKPIATANQPIPCRVLMARKGMNPEQKEKFTEIIGNMGMIFQKGGEPLTQEKFGEFMKRYDFKKAAELQKKLQPLSL